MNPIMKLIDNAMKWSIRPTKDGARIVYDAAIEAETYLEDSQGVYVVRFNAGVFEVTEVRSGRTFSDPSLDRCLISLGATHIFSGAV